MFSLARRLLPLGKQLCLPPVSELKTGQLSMIASSLTRFFSDSSIKAQPKLNIESEQSVGSNKAITAETVHQVNDLLKKGEEGRLFAVVHVCGKQFKVTSEDIIIIEGHWAPQLGDQIKLEKVLVAGGKDFTLIGRPLLPSGLVSVQAQVIEKDLSHTKIIFRKRRRKQYMRTNFYRSLFTMLRIQEVAITRNIDDTQDVIQYTRV